MKNYFRITGYCPEHDFSFIVDSNGMFERLWQFSSFLIQKGLKVLEVSSIEKIKDTNIEPIGEDKNHIILRAIAEGKPEYVKKEVDDLNCNTIKVKNIVYSIYK